MAHLWPFCRTIPCGHSIDGGFLLEAGRHTLPGLACLGRRRKTQSAFLEEDRTRLYV